MINNGCNMNLGDILNQMLGTCNVDFPNKSEDTTERELDELSNLINQEEEIHNKKIAEYQRKIAAIKQQQERNKNKAKYIVDESKVIHFDVNKETAIKIIQELTEQIKNNTTNTFKFKVQI